IDMALFDAQIAVLANQNLNFLVSGKSPVQMGNAHPNIAPYEVLPAADGHFILAVGNDGQFQKFCKAVGLDALPQDADFATNAAGVPASPINTIGEMFSDPQVKARGMRLDLDDGHGNRLPSVRSPMRLSETPLVYDRSSPRLGEHTAEILAELEKK